MNQFEMIPRVTAEPSFLVLCILAAGIASAVLANSNTKLAMPWQVGAPLIGVIAFITLPGIWYFARQQQAVSLGEIPSSPPTELALGGFVIAFSAVLFAGTKFLTQAYDRRR